MSVEAIEDEASSLGTAYQEGYEAGAQSLSIAVCPYKRDGGMWKCWRDGWADGNYATRRKTGTQ